MDTFSEDHTYRSTSNVLTEMNGSSNGKSPHESHLDFDPFISNEACRVLEIIFYAVLSFTVCVVGTTANIINIIIFSKQGFNDSINISLLGVSVSDLCVLLTLMWMCLCFNPLFQYSDIQFDSLQIQYITAGWPNACFSRITSWITALITFERCVCITVPMKVKAIITPKRTLISIVLIYLVMFANVSPVFYSVYFSTTFNTERNKTTLGFSYTNNSVILQNFSYSVNVFSQFSSCIIVVICTVILIYNLQVKSYWRHKAIAVSSNDKLISVSLRDGRVIKMVTSISCIFIICYFPITLNIILIIHFTPDYNINGRYHNSFNVSWAILSTFEAVNSSVNILVYYNMSSKFRASFNKRFSIFSTFH